MLNARQEQELLALARSVITCRLQGGSYRTPDDEVFQREYGAFVTLHKDGKLRGCIGYIEGYKDIVSSIAEMAIAAAFRDPRFPPVQAAELPDLQIEISLLSPLVLVQDISEIQVGRDGLFLQQGSASGLLLPQVATEWNWDRATFLTQVCSKAGLPDKAWQHESAELYRFTAKIFSEQNPPRA